MYAGGGGNMPSALNLVSAGNFSAEDVAREYYGSDKPQYEKYTSGPNKGELVATVVLACQVFCREVA